MSWEAEREWIKYGRCCASLRPWRVWRFGVRGGIVHQCFWCRATWFEGKEGDR